ncbi:hypothetical protein J0H58_30120 [bacterium]|nr:hypothetical protein [bacterium]
MRAGDLAPKPRSLDHVHAAAVPLSALTTWQAFFVHAGLAAGQRILIHDAAGGVGVFAAQLARRKGARVSATASARHHAFLRGRVGRRRLRGRRGLGRSRVRASLLEPRAEGGIQFDSRRKPAPRP